MSFHQIVIFGQGIFFFQFKKVEDGIPFAVDVNATLDDLKDLQAANDNKLDEIAKSLGLTSEALVKAMRDGSINQVIQDAVATKEKEGE